MKLSLIIPSYNGQELLAQNLPQVFQALRTWDKKLLNSEVMVVDDASTDGTDDWLKREYPKVQVVVNRRNLRFGQSCNRGVIHAQGDVVVLLNNDVEPREDFLLNLLKHFSDEQVFAVGCRERNIESGKEIYGGRGASAFKRGLMVHWRPKDQETTNTSWVSAGSAAYRRDLWLKLGGFDPLFRPAYEEDRDLCWQAVKAGYRLVFEPKSLVTHSHETTNVSVFGPRRIKLYSLKNQLLFVWKNISGPRLIFQHFLWLPYHLIVTCLRTRGLFFLAFLMALMQLPEAIRSRARASKHWQRDDEEILAGD